MAKADGPRHAEAGPVTTKMGKTRHLTVEVGSRDRTAVKTK
jgi:hypothetical protein